MRRLPCSRKVERAMGIEPTSSAWEAEVMAIIRRPQNWQFYRGLGGDGKRGVLAAGIETGAARPARQPMSKMDESASEAYKPK